MKMKEKQVSLKNDTKVILKSVGEAEAEAVLEFMKAVYSETDNLTLTADEVAEISIEAEHDVILNYEKEHGSIMLAAYLDGQIIGNCAVQRYSEKAKHSHRAEVGIAVKKEYWNLGIGSALLSTAIEFASKVGYEQLELETANNNVNAILLYNKFNFLAVGRIPHAHKVGEGYRDNLKFVKYLGRKEKQ